MQWKEFRSYSKYGGGHQRELQKRSRIWFMYSVDHITWIFGQVWLVTKSNAFRCYSHCLLKCSQWESPCPGPGWKFWPTWNISVHSFVIHSSVMTLNCKPSFSSGECSALCNNPNPEFDLVFPSFLSPSQAGTLWEMCLHWKQGKTDFSSCPPQPSMWLLQVEKAELCGLMFLELKTWLK